MQHWPAGVMTPLFGERHLGWDQASDLDTARAAQPERFDENWTSALRRRPQERKKNIAEETKKLQPLYTYTY